MRQLLYSMLPSVVIARSMPDQLLPARRGEREISIRHVAPAIPAFP